MEKYGKWFDDESEWASPEEEVLAKQDEVEEMVNLGSVDFPWFVTPQGEVVIVA